MSSKLQVSRLGMPINFLLAICVGLFLGNQSATDLTQIPDNFAGYLALALILQELILVQYMSHDANIAYQYRVLNGEINRSRRLQLLLLPLFLLLVIGLFGVAISERSLDFSAFLRVLSISTIIVLGLDPLFGLSDRGFLATFGAAVVYLLVIGTALQKISILAVGLSTYVGVSVSISATYLALSYFLLSIRWTYYRLFCFNQVDEPFHVVIDSIIPFMIILSPSLPQFWNSTVWLFTGI